MKKLILLPIVISFFSLTSIYTGASNDVEVNTNGWKAGVARLVITPEQPMWMAGYAGRDRPSEGTLHDLWAKVLALEDANGKRAVLITADIVAFSTVMTHSIQERLKAKFGLSNAQVILSSSHTHTGPVLRGLTSIYPLDSHQLELIEHYSCQLEDQIATLVGKALDSMVPVQIFSDNGVARFAVNRRNNPAATLNPATQLVGPVDHSVPVIKIAKTSGELLAVVFGYACHTTSLGIYHFSGDYAGFAQIELEEAFPGTTAMFFAGAGADQNPLPRRTVGLARQYGKTLAAAVEAVISDPMPELEPILITSYTEIDIPHATLPTREELQKLEKESSGHQKNWASRMIVKLDRDKTLPASYPYPLQIWRIGGQNLVVLGGEVVVDYSLKLKEILGQDLFVMAYANDIGAGYIPSTRVLREGGYEGVSAFIYFDRPAPWNANIELLILQGVLELAEQAGITLPESRLIGN